MSLYERRPSAGARTCAAVEHAGAEPTLAPVARLSERAFAPSATSHLCGLELRLTPNGDGLFVGALLGARPPPPPQASASLRGDQAATAPLRWVLPIEEVDRAVEYRLLVVAGRVPVDRAVAWIGETADSGDAIARLGRYGVLAEVYGFALTARRR